MPFERSQFGNNVDIGSGGNVNGFVNTHYETRVSGNQTGLVKTYGTFDELAIDFDGAQLSKAEFPLIAPTLPAGTSVTSVMFKVTEAFVVVGTTPAVEIGTQGSEVTNGFTTTEAQLETVGSVDLTAALSGTWAAVLAAETTVGVALSGAGASVSPLSGKGKWIIQYTHVNS